MRKIVAALSAVLAIGYGAVALAKLPPPAPMTDEQKVKAEEVKAKAAETAKKEADLLGKAQDRAAENYKKNKAVAAAPAAKVAEAAKKK